MNYRFNQIEIDTNQYEIRAHGEALSVEPKVFDLIVYLITHRDRLISREELFENIWSGREVSDTSLSNHVKSARKALGDNGDLQKIIKTVRSRGYQFIAVIESSSDEQSKAQVNKLSSYQTKPSTLLPAKVSPPFFIKSFNHLLILIVFLSIVVVWGVTTIEKEESSAPNLLVVPFSIASNSTENWQAFTDQISRDVIQHLRKISGLTVVPPPSSFAFKSNKFRHHIKQKLPSVEYVLDGVVSEANNGNLRISVELENINTNEVIWDGDFDVQRGNENLFSIQSEIASSVSKSLQVIMLAQEKKELIQIPTVSLKAYELYMQGQFQFTLMTHESVLASISYFNQAIELDPLFEAAYLAKSKAYRVIMVLFDKPKEVLPKVISSAIALLTIKPESAQIKSSLGLAYVHAWLWDDAWKMLTQARNADPNIALTELGFALYYSAMGNLEGVKLALKKASQLDPLNEEIADWGLWALMMVGETETARAWGSEQMKLHPNTPYLPVGLAIVEYIMGNHDKSIKLAMNAVTLSQRKPFPLIILAQSYAAMGNKEKARELIVEAEDQNQYLCPYETAIVYILMGENENAFAQLEQAHEYQSNCLIFIRNDPRLLSLKNDPRYLSLLKKVTLDDEAVKGYFQ